MGLSAILLCDFVVCTFKGLIIIRRKFDELNFHERLKKHNKFIRIICYQRSVNQISFVYCFKVFQDFLSIQILPTNKTAAQYCQSLWSEVSMRLTCIERRPAATTGAGGRACDTANIFYK